jgi:hypothetical protein
MDATHTADEWSTSRHPQDWGRALSMVLARLAEQLAEDEGGKIDEVLVDRDVRVRIAPEADGIRITATCANPRAEGGHDFM